MAILKKFTPLTLSQLEKEDSSSVYVINNTNPRGMIHISANDGAGNALAITIPITNIPVDLTTQATKQTLMNSPRFRSLIMQRALLVMGASDAEGELQREDMREEINRVYNVISGGAGLTQEVFSAQVVGAEQSLEDPNSPSNVSPFAMTLAHNEEAEGSQEGENLVFQMRSRPGELTLGDFEYIAQHSKFTRVKNYAAEQAAELRAAQ